MANSVVTVTDAMLNDSLLLLVGEDGTVTPDRETVETYLNSKSGATNIQLMHINKTDKKGIDISVDHLTYVPDVMNEVEFSLNKEGEGMEDIARNLQNFRLDHDYTCFLSPLRGQESSQPEEDLVQTLNDSGTNQNETEQLDEESNLVTEKPEAEDNARTSDTSEGAGLTTAPSKTTKGRAKIITTKALKQTAKTTSSRQSDRAKTKEKPKIVQQIEDEFEEDYEDGENDEDLDFEDDENDSDFEIDDVSKPKVNKRGRTRRKSQSGAVKTYNKQQTNQLKSEAKQQSQESPKNKDQQKKTKIKMDVVQEMIKVEKSLEKPVDTQTEQDKANLDSKKTPKKEKKPPKPIPNDFMLFSTPDIIRRVGKEGQTPTPDTPTTSPAKITNESRSKSVGEQTGANKSGRSSLDGRNSSNNAAAVVKSEKTGGSRDRRTSNSDKLSRKNSTESINKRMKDEGKPGAKSANLYNQSPEKFGLETMPTPEDIRSIIMTEDVKSFTTNSIPLIQTSDVSSSGGQAAPAAPSSQDQIGLDAGGLDIDQSILDNINNDEISEDILYQVAQSLVMNTDLSNAIDKGLNEGNLMLDTSSMQESSVVDAHAQQQTAQVQGAQQTKNEQQQDQQQTDIIKEATQIVRPDGRILILPPIERPATRSRNRKKNTEDMEIATPPPPRIPVKPLDDEHVSGNELDDTDDDFDDNQEEDESEDDPNKLWCICNQPHNNRFMICCDTCEEWYHGKCVNVTKTMGQQMEEEGREWICLFCKDSSLKRPQAAARRIRKASRASTDSAESSKRSSGTTTPKSAGSQQAAPKSAKQNAQVTCIVCHKPARENSIYCSQNCILAHASGVERVVVFERSTGKMLSGSKAPSSSNLEQWLKAHPTFEVYRSGGKIVTSKVQQRQPNQLQKLTQSKLKIVKNSENHGVSLEVRRRGIKMGVLKHHPKHDELSPKVERSEVKTPAKPMGIKSDGEPQKFYAKTATAPGSAKKPGDTPPASRLVKSLTPNKPKLVQTTIKTTPKDNLKDKTQPIKTPKSRQAELEKAQQQQSQPKQKQQQPEEQQTTPTSANSGGKQQEDVRENVQKTLFEQLTNRIKMDGGNLKLKEEELKEISTEIESQLFKCFGDTGQKYRNKYRSLIFNIKDVKNQTLWKRICEKSINAYQLVRLSPDDMASQELAMWREREAKHSLDMIKKSELELLNCSRQYVLKTHKGEQVVDEDNRPSSEKVDNAEVIRTLTEDHPSDGRDPKSDATSSVNKDSSSKKSSKRAHRDKDRDRRSSKERGGSKERHKKRRRSTSKERSSEKSGSGRDRSSSKRERKRSRSRDRHRKSSSSSSRHSKNSKDGGGGGIGAHISSTDKLDKRSKEILEQLVDNKIVPPLEDRLWKHVPQEDVVPGHAESDSDHEPSSTVTIPTPPHNVEAEEQTTSSTTTTTTTQVVENKIIASSLTPKLEESNSKEQEVERSMSPPPPRKQAGEIWRGTISMIDVAHITITAHEVSGDCTDLGEQLPSNLDIVGRISPETVWDYIGKMKCSNSKIISLVRLSAVDVVEKMPYLALYSYLSSRKRLGVVKSTNKAIKDFYILPLAPQKPIPQALLPINGPGFEESRPALLLGIVVRDRRKRSALADPLPLYPPSLTPKKTRVSTPPIVARIGTPPVAVVDTPTATVSETPRSYTPPATTPLLTSAVNKDPRVKTVPTPSINLSSPPSEEKEVDDGDEPYSPEDSDPDNSMMVAPVAAAVPSNFSEPPPPLPKPSMAAYPYTTIIPGLDVGAPLPASTLEIQKQMEELNKKIEAQKSEINNISKNIVSASTEIGQSALANIALPSNLQQILDSIKTISTEGSVEENPAQSKPVDPSLTIPLMLPKSFTRPPPPIINNPKQQQLPPQLDFVTNTIPLNLPTKNKLKLPPPAALMSVPPPSIVDPAPGLLSSLSEEDLVKKAAEMLGEAEVSPSKKGVALPSPKKPRLEENDMEGFDIEPPIPGVDN